MKFYLQIYMKIDKHYIRPCHGFRRHLDDEANA